MRKNYTGKHVGEVELSRDLSSSAIEYNLFLKQNLTDINPISAGATKHHTTHRFASPTGIHTANCTHLYQILGGSGSLHINGRNFRVKTNDFFVVPLGAIAGLQADAGSDLPHRWIGFIGTLTQDFERFPIPFTLPPEIVSQFCDPQKAGRNLGSRLAADLFIIHSLMQEPEENEPDYVQKVVNWVNTSYMEKLSVTSMAQSLGLDRCHLSRLFKQKMNMSIQDYILQFRIARAKRYLNHNYSVSDTAQLCGFSDRTHFSKLFTREVGCSPTEWIKIIEWEGWNKPR